MVGLPPSPDCNRTSYYKTRLVRNSFDIQDPSAICKSKKHKYDLPWFLLIHLVMLLVSNYFRYKAVVLLRRNIIIYFEEILQ